MNWPRRRPECPRIHTDKAQHQWTQAFAPDGPFRTEYVMTCARCSQRPRTMDPERFRSTHARGCAGRRFRGRYRTGDHVDTGNLRYRFLHYQRRGAAAIEDMGERGRVRIVPVAELRPVLAGRAEAEKRRVAHVEQLTREGKLDG